MLTRVFITAGALGFLANPSAVMGQGGTAGQGKFEPETMRFSEVVNGTAKVVEYKGRRAVTLVRAPDKAASDADILAILDGSELKDGTIDLWVAGAPRSDAPPDARGFVGVAFHVAPHAEQSEVMYIRPTNGRADDQLRRNHSAQYVSHPDYTWQRLRQESPGVYESYVDLESGVWTRMRIVIAGTTARLYVNDASQPCLVVNDLKRGAVGGSIALWAHVSTEAYFGSLTVKPGTGD